MPHPGLGDWHLVCKISYRVNQTSQGCHPLTRCFVGVHKQSVGHIDTVNTPTSVCFRISFWLALSARRPPELMLHSTLGSPDEIKQSHFQLEHKAFSDTHTTSGRGFTEIYSQSEELRPNVISMSAVQTSLVNTNCMWEKISNYKANFSRQGKSSPILTSAGVMGISKDNKSIYMAQEKYGFLKSKSITLLR